MPAVTRKTAALPTKEAHDKNKRIALIRSRELVRRAKIAKSEAAKRAWDSRKANASTILDDDEAVESVGRDVLLDDLPENV